MPMRAVTKTAGSPIAGPAATPRSNPALRSSFAVGFLILFAFIGTFTYVNFVLVSLLISPSMMSVGLVYFVFIPAAFTTPLAGYAADAADWQARRLLGSLFGGARRPSSVVVHAAGASSGRARGGSRAGTFFAQAGPNWFRRACRDCGSCGGEWIYLACYYFGGVAGSALLGQVFERFGWAACVGVIGLSLVLAAILAAGMNFSPPPPAYRTSTGEEHQ